MISSSVDHAATERIWRSHFLYLRNIQRLSAKTKGVPLTLEGPCPLPEDVFTVVCCDIHPFRRRKALAAWHTSQHDVVNRGRGQTGYTVQWVYEMCVGLRRQCMLTPGSATRCP